MNQMNNLQSLESIIKRLTLSRVINFFGSAFSDFVLPLFIFETTQSPLLMAIQWTLSSLAKLVAGKVSGTFHLASSNKKALIILDVIQGLAVLIPLLFWNSFPIIGTMLSGIILSFSGTLQAGYLESFLFNLTEDCSDKTERRTQFNSRLDRSKNFGLFLGYLVAWAASTYIGYQFAILMDALTFIVSALLISKLTDNHVLQLKLRVKESFSLLFRHQKISLLTTSQAFLSFSIFIFNSSFIYVMKKNFNADNRMIAILLILQTLIYIIGGSLVPFFKKMSLSRHVGLRYLYFIIFLGFVFSLNEYHFIFWNICLSLLISFTQPTIMAQFQSFSNSQNARNLGAARASLMAVTGSVGSAVSGVILDNFSYQYAFSLGVIFSFVCGILFHIYFFKTKTEQTSNI